MAYPAARPAGGPLATPAPIAQLPVGSPAPGPLMNAPPQAPGQPLATVPHTVIPQIAPYTAPTGLGPPPATAPTGQFTGTAPTATPYGTFTAPDANNFTTDPSYQWRLSQGLKAIQGSAAARGTLLSGATEKSLSDYAGGSASQEYGNAYNRALQSYTANRDTNAQNFGQNQTVFGDTLASYGANRDTNAQNFGQAQTQFGDTLPIYDRKVAAAQTAQQQQQAQMDRDAAAQNQNADEYARMVEAQRASSMPASRTNASRQSPNYNGAAAPGGVAAYTDYPYGGYNVFNRPFPGSTYGQ